MDPSTSRDWIDYATIGAAALALIVSIASAVFTGLGYRIGSKRELKIETEKAISKDDPLRITVHNLGSRAETLSKLTLLDGSRRFEIRLENMVVPANDYRAFDLNRELVKYEWHDDLPRLGPDAVLEIKAVSGATAVCAELDANLLLDGMAAVFVQMKAEMDAAT